MIRIAILGAGIGGLTAAHELSELAPDFQIDVYEASNAIGGKARSQLLSGTGTGGRRDLPGEHGFRFFPSWYRHIPDTLSRIPVEGPGVVLDRLVGCSEFGMADADRTSLLRLPRQGPENVGEMFDLVETARSFYRDTDVSALDLGTFCVRMLAYIVQCEERRREEHEHLSFYDYIGGHRFTPKFQRYLNSSRFMVAMDARAGSACTIGNKVIQLLLDFRRPRGTNDRALDGPTTERWLAPWGEYLSRRGVRFHFGKKLERLEMQGQRIHAASFAGETAPVRADFFVLALPLERAQISISDPMAKASKHLHVLREAERMTSWMVGAQFFLRRDVPMCNGHVAYPDSPWALSSISQASLWGRGKPAQYQFRNVYGNGQCEGVLSVDISDWHTASPRIGKSAAQCRSAAEVLDEVWEQLKEGANGPNETLLDDHNVLSRHLDANVRFDGECARNESPLLVHPPGSWYKRPPAAPEGILNLFLAADYVQTSTDLASMEGASEAARMAVNTLLDRATHLRAEMVPTGRSRVFPLQEDAGVLINCAKIRDRERWLRGEVREPVASDEKLDPTRTFDLSQAAAYQQQLELALRST